MYKYFTMLSKIAELDNRCLSIKEITIELANSAGYHRDVFTFKNGNQRIRTMYDSKFDDVLTAKWLCYYKHLFVSKLSKHPELKEFHDFIINRTFMIVMNSVNLDKLVNDDVINKYVNIALGNRISEVLQIIGSQERLKNGKFKLKTAINHMSISLESLQESGNYNAIYNDVNYSELVVDLKHKLCDNKLGLELLNLMLESNYKIRVNSIDQYVKCEQTEENKKALTDAYNIIKNTLREHLHIPKTDRRWKPIKTVKFLNEVKNGTNIQLQC